MFKRPAAKGHRDRTSPSRVLRTTLEAEALRLRRDGHCFDEIAEMLGGNMTESKVQYMVQAALERKGKPEANDLRQQLLDQMDRLMNRAIRIAKQDKNDRVAALNAAVNIANRMAALTGADAPKAVDIKDDRQHGVDPTAREALVARLAQEAVEDEPEGS